MAAVTPAFLEPYLTTKYRHVYYHDAVELAEELAVHANGEFPDDLITERRPAESEEIKNYREKIFTPITKPVFTKVYNSLMKIRKSSDWMISFPSDVSAMIAADETPEEYLMKKFPLTSKSSTGIIEKPTDPEYYKNFLVNGKPIPKNKKGGQKGLKKYTSKNVYTSVNDIMLRNEKVFGPAGKRRYKPGLNYKDGGGWLDNMY